MGNRLQPILQATLQDLVEKKSVRSLAQLESDLSHGKAPVRRNFAQALRQIGQAETVNSSARSSKNLAIIAEIKRNSPSMGAIATENMDVPTQARLYEQGGANCLSILTEPHYFKGNLADMQAGRAAVALPVLRKDFMIDRWQLAETRLMGADCALLIVAALGAETSSMLNAAQEYGLDVLVEIHDRAELDIALAANAKMIGVNNRNLTSFHVDLAIAENLRPHIPGHIITIAESGLKEISDYRRMRDAGYDAVLVGTSLMKSGDPAARLAAIRQGLANPP